MHYDILHELCANLSATGKYALTTNLSFQPAWLSIPNQTSGSQSSLSTTMQLAVSDKGDVQEEGVGKYVPTGSKLITASKDCENFKGQWVREEIVCLDSQSRKLAYDQGKRKRGGAKRMGQDIEEKGSEGEEEEEEEEEEESLHTPKKVRRERNTTGRAITQALDRLGTTAQTIQRPARELAVERVQQDYCLSFTANELVKAFFV